MGILSSDNFLRELVDRDKVIIAGGMKCGTTWLHNCLNKSESISISNGEYNFFDGDDLLCHPDYQQITRVGLKRFRSDFDSESHRVSFSSPLQDEKYVGFDCTTIIHAQMDFKKLDHILPNAKYIVLLRNPLHRSVSHYWHLVRTGRTHNSFEKEILFGNKEIIYRSIYVNQVRRIKHQMGKRVLFLNFDKLFTSPKAELTKVVQFLDLPESDIEIFLDTVTQKKNYGRYPRFLTGWLFASRCLSGLERFRYYDQLHSKSGTFKIPLGWLFYLKIFIMTIFGGGYTSQKRPLKNETLNQLNTFLLDANHDLSSIIGEPFVEYWTKNEQV
mgnify:CR=1 FL=1